MISRSILNKSSSGNQQQQPETGRLLASWKKIQTHKMLKKKTLIWMDNCVQIIQAGKQ